MKNINLELNRILTLMEVRDKVSLPLLNEGQQALLNSMQNLDAETQSEIKQKIETAFDPIIQTLRKSGCFMPKKYPIIYDLSKGALCAIIIICIIVGTEGIGATQIAAICWALQCTFDIYDKVDALSGDQTKYQSLVRECNSLGKCSKTDFNSIYNGYQKTLNDPLQSAGRTITNLLGM
jgi:hypothetical protein